MYVGPGLIRKGTFCMKRPCGTASGLSHVILACTKSQLDLEAMGSRCRTTPKVEKNEAFND